MLFQIMFYDVKKRKHVVANVYKVYSKNNSIRAIIFYNDEWKDIDLNMNVCVPITDDCEDDILSQHPNIRITGDEKEGLQCDCCGEYLDFNLNSIDRL